MDADFTSEYPVSVILPCSPVRIVELEGRDLISGRLLISFLERQSLWCK